MSFQRSLAAGPLVFLTLVVLFAGGLWHASQAQAPPQATVPATALSPAQSVTAQRAAGPTARSKSATAASTESDKAKPRTELPEKPFATDKEAEEAAAKKKTEWLQKINQLAFDRRPSTILRAWSSSAAEEEAREKDEQVKAAEAQALMQGSPAPQPEPNVKPDPFDAKLRAFRRAVTLSQWPEVASFLNKLPTDEGKALYRRLLQMLQTAPFMMNNMMPDQAMMQRGMMMQQQQGFNQMFMEKNTFSNADVIALAGACPYPLGDVEIEGLSQILKLALAEGHVIEDFVARLKAATANPKSPLLTRRQAARLLVSADHAVEAGFFLPDIRESRGR